MLEVIQSTTATDSLLATDGTDYHGFFLRISEIFKVVVRRGDELMVGDNTDHRQV